MAYIVARILTFRLNKTWITRAIKNLKVAVLYYINSLSRSYLSTTDRMFIDKCRKKLGKSETISPDLVAIKTIATYYSQHAKL